MVYFIPRGYKCGKCDFTFDYSPSNSYTVPIFLNDSDPLCPMCVAEFLAVNVPTMRLITNEG